MSLPAESPPHSPLVIAVDAMGGDHGPPVFVAGVALALKRLAGRPVRFLLHGDRARIEAEVARRSVVAPHVAVRHTDKVIAGDEKPAQALRRGKDSSMWNAIAAVKAGEAQGCVSGGNTGALMAISKLQLRMAGGLDRPAIVASWPTARGVTDVLDVGANIDCDAEQLVEFAIMGEAFHCAVHAPKDAKGAPCRPRVGILNVGSEEMKGHAEVREAHRILREGKLDLDYFGFVEGDDIAKGTVDVIVTDGFTGNVALKTAEGLARFFRDELRAALTATPLATAGALLARGSLEAMRARMTPPGGGPLLGLNGVVVKTHGSASAEGVADGLKIAADLAESGYAAQIARNMAAFTHAEPAPAEAAS